MTIRHPDPDENTDGTFCIQTYKHEFIFDHDNEEQFRLFLKSVTDSPYGRKEEKTLLGTFNHDRDGWAGMETVQELIEDISKQLNIKVTNKRK